jgi:hypothetical protein
VITHKSRVTPTDRVTKKIVSFHFAKKSKEKPT